MKYKKIVKLPTGIVTKIDDTLQGRISVHTDSEKNFLPYLNTFQSFEFLEKVKNDSKKQQN